MKIARIAGIVIKVHIGLFLLMGLYIYLGYGFEILFVFTAVLMHEMAHALMAVWLKVKVSEVELMPFGGQAKIEDFTGADIAKEISIAVMGPLFSLMLAAFFYFLPDIHLGLGAKWFFQVNLALGCFNLLPALPLDGGRILRAILSAVIGYRQATKWSAGLGKFIGLGLIGYGGYCLYAFRLGINELVIGMLLFWAASREEKFMHYTFMRFLIHKKGELAKQGLLPVQALVCLPETQVRQILAQSKPNQYLLVTIISRDHHVKGICSEAEMIDAVMEGGPNLKMHDLCR